MRRVGGVALVLLLAAGCGVPVDRHARPIPDDHVPFDLLNPDRSSATPAQAEPAAATVTVYLVDGDRLVPVPRRVPNPLSPARAVEALLAGPTGDESGRGVRTAILPGAPVVVTGAADGEARVDLGPTLPAVASKDLIFIAAQVVYTLTGLPGIGSVAFTVSGRPAELPTPGGGSRGGAFRRSDYAAVANL